MVGGKSTIIARMLHPYRFIGIGSIFFPHSIVPKIKSNSLVGQKHLGDNIERKIKNLMSKCFALTSRKNLDRNKAFDRSED
jgi:hypothetical protein